MTIAEARAVQPGDRVRMRDRLGVVSASGVDSFGNHYVSVVWDGCEVGNPLRYSYFNTGSARSHGLRRLHKT